MPDDNKMPEQLITALREVDKGRVFVPPELDAVILAKAKANLARGRKRTIIPWLAAAAAVAIAAIVMLKPMPKVREDVNRDGRVDIRDALLLARKVSAGQAVGVNWDLNGDGKVDEADAALIAAQAVKLAKGDRS
jgi:dockerin type I repeat protein